MIISLKQVKYVGEKTYHSFVKNSIWSTYDLVLRRPKNYENYVLTSINEATNDSVITIIGTVASSVSSYKKKVSISKFFIHIENKKIEVTAFNQPYLEKALTIGQEILIKGKYNIYTKKIIANKISLNPLIPNLKPIYNYEGIHDTQVYKIMKEIFLKEQVTIYENLPKPLLKKHHLLERKKAYEYLHLPPNLEVLKQAIRRLKYEEAYQQQKAWLKTIKERPLKQALAYDITYVKDKISKIPYTLTKDQQRVVNEIFLDFKKGYTTERLIQGDVGSGKTVVAFLAAIGAISAGKKAVLMAPTEILAQQHYQNFISLYPEIKTALLTSKVKNKNQVLSDLENDEPMMVIGTHALASEKVVIDDLGLIIIDEQHKFGVKIKETLKLKNHLADIIYLTATPIPRTLAIAYFGDLDVSVIKEKPANRKAVETKIVDEKTIFKTLISQQEKNEQTYIVVPAIDSETKSYNIKQVDQALKKAGIKHVYLLHGKQKIEEQETMMKNFSADTKGILLATSMIEVGIDIKNATTIFILGANHFGLSQLHQLRGRVGRGDKESFCYLVSEKEDDERLMILSKETDGFILSQFDLKTRGPGEFLGERQSGYLKYNYLDLTQDLNILIQARKDVENYI